MRDLEELGLLLTYVGGRLAAATGGSVSPPTPTDPPTPADPAGAYSTTYEATY